MAEMKVDFAGVTATGKGSCHGGVHPHPPFHDYHFLAWMHTGHPRHGMQVFLEDQTASVEEIATEFATTHDLAGTAAKFGTTEEHVQQAVAYALRAGFLWAQ
jgi:hypothetical protein